MALSGTFSKSATDGTIYVKWNATQDIPALQSAVTITLEFKPSTTFTVNNYSYELIYNGISVGKGSLNKKTFTSGVTYTLATVTRTITHSSSDGTASRAVSGTFWYTNSSGVIVYPAEASGTMMLDTIPIATKPTVSASTVNLGSSVTISLPRNVSTLTHGLTWEFEGYTGTIGTTSATSYSWTLPSSFATYLSNKTSGTCIVKCKTYRTVSGALTQVGETKQTSFKVSVASGTVPTITNLSATEGNSAVRNTGLTKYVQGKSYLNVSITASAPTGATIASVQTRFDGSIYDGTSFTTKVITNSGTLDLTVTVTDSRGRSATQTLSLTVLPYQHPDIISPSIFRGDTSSSVNDESTTIQYTWYGQYSPLDGKNSYKRRIAWRTQGSSSWTYGSTVTDTGKTGSFAVSMNTTSKPATTTYDVLIDVWDVFDEHVTYQSSVSTAKRPLEFGADGYSISLGKACENDGTCDVGIPLKINGGIDYTPHPWITVDAFTDSVYSVKSNYPLRYRKIGNHVYLHGWFTVSSSFVSGVTAKDLFTLPSGYRPRYLVTAYASGYLNEPYVALVNVYANGTVRIYNIWRHGQTGALPDNMGVTNGMCLTLDFFTD